MDVITAATMEALTTHAPGPCVSIYMPTHRSGRETLQGPIRLGNLLDEASRQLDRQGVDRSDVEEMLAEARRLVDDHRFWQHQEDGLAVFIAPKTTKTFRLPERFDELVVTADAFHVKPLWALLSGGELFHILALSRNDIRVLWADRFRTGEVDFVDDVPTSLAEALWYDDAERQLQQHAGTRVGDGRVVAHFHGHAGGEETDDEKLASFLRTVDRALRDLMDPASPLVLAGTEELAARFRGISQHQAMVDEIVRGNPDDLTPEDLHEAALAIMLPRLRRDRDQDAERVGAAGDRAVRSVTSAVEAALSHRVELLFIPTGVEAWGRWDPAAMGASLHERREPGDRDLLDQAAMAVWSSGGRVHVVPPEEIPGDGPVAAVLRY